MRYISSLFLALVILTSCSGGEQATESEGPDYYTDSGMEEEVWDVETLEDEDVSENELMSEEGGWGAEAGEWDVPAGPGPIASSILPGAGPAPPPSAPPAQASEDAYLDQLRSYPIAYEFPSEGQQGTAFEVTLAIDATGDDSAVEGLPQKDIVVEAAANLSRTVEATLSGAAFDIKLTNKERQRLSPIRESVWRWSVTPLQAGEHVLYLELHAVVGDDETVLLESYADNINVNVSAVKPAGSRTDLIRNIISIIGGVISITLGAIALIGHIRKRNIGSGGD